MWKFYFICSILLGIRGGFATNSHNYGFLYGFLLMFVIGLIIFLPVVLQDPKAFKCPVCGKGKPAKAKLCIFCTRDSHNTNKNLEDDSK